jgi:hypothetical protein
MRQSPALVFSLLGFKYLMTPDVLWISLKDGEDLELVSAETYGCR